MDFKLPFPTLQDLAVLEIAHSLMELDSTTWGYDYLVESKEKSLRESLSKVDKLLLPEKQKCRIREAVRGTDDHLQNTSRSLIRYIHNRECSKLQFDVHGCVDEVRMARDFLQRCHSDEGWDTNLRALQNLLKVATYYALLPDIQKILLKILKLHARDSLVPLLEGPEFQIDTEEKLCLVYRFVGQQGIPMSLTVDYYDNGIVFPVVLVSNTCVRITFNCFYYNSELFQLHWNLLQPSKRILFARKVLIHMSHNLVHQVIDILHFLDLDSRRCTLDRIRPEWENFKILRYLLVWPYQVFFLPALQLVRSVRELQHYQLIDLFEIIVSKLDMVAFEEILLPFWEAISSELKSRYSHLSLHTGFENLLKELSRKNVPMYKIVAADLNLQDNDSSSANLDS